MSRSGSTAVRLGWCVAAGVCAAARLASGVILLATGDPASHTSTPGDNSGWQYEGIFGGFLGTPIAPLYFLAAGHVGNQGTLVFHGETFKVVSGEADPAGSDLVLWKVDHAFADYAPLFTAAKQDETGQPLRVFGRGTQRGAEINFNGTACGWQWGPGDGVERWGSNVVADLLVDSSNNAPYVHATFDYPGVADEAHLSAGDSSGGLFVMEDGLWKLAAVNYAVDDLYTGANGSGNFTAAIYDAQGYYTSDDGQTYALITDHRPTGFYSTRVAARLTWLQTATGLDPATLAPESFAAWGHLYFSPAQLADATQSGPAADPDGDGVSNLLEFAFNLDPTFAEPAAMVAGTGLRGLPLVGLAAGAAGDRRLTVEFVRRTPASGSGLTYAVQFATDLAAADWQTGGTTAVTAINARWERVKVTDSPAAAGGAAAAHRFARVLVTMAATP